MCSEITNDPSTRSGTNAVPLDLFSVLVDIVDAHGDPIGGLDLLWSRHEHDGHRHAVPHLVWLH